MHFILPPQRKTPGEAFPRFPADANTWYTVNIKTSGRTLKLLLITQNSPTAGSDSPELLCTGSHCPNPVISPTWFLLRVYCCLKYSQTFWNYFLWEATSAWYRPAQISISHLTIFPFVVIWQKSEILISFFPKTPLVNSGIPQWEQRMQKKNQKKLFCQSREVSEI